jgi:hypothetical protein
MTTTAAYPAPMRANVLRRAEAWLDAKGRAAWIAAMVLGFIVFWPIGLALLAYMIWGKKMFGHSCRKHGGSRHDHDHRSAWAAEWGRADRTAFRASGNAAFDSYKADTLRRLEEEQEAFEGFLQRLRQAKDKSEFDSFMDDRARKTREAAAETGAETRAADPQDPARRGEY